MAKATRTPNPWWTPEIEKLVQEERQERRRGINGDQQAREQQKKAGQKKAQLIKHQKRKTFQEEVYNADTSESGIWRLIRWARAKGGKAPELPTIPDLDTLEGKATTLPEKAKAL